MDKKVKAEYMNESFWEKLDSIISLSKIIIDRPKGSLHPKYPSMIYPVDYGYLKDTSGGDGNEIDIWIGSKEGKNLESIACTVDILKKDTEIKLLIGCTESDEQEIISFLNNNGYMSAILIKRNSGFRKL